MYHIYILLKKDQKKIYIYIAQINLNLPNQRTCKWAVVIHYLDIHKLYPHTSRVGYLLYDTIRRSPKNKNKKRSPSHYTFLYYNQKYFGKNYRVLNTIEIILFFQSNKTSVSLVQNWHKTNRSLTRMIGAV